VQREAEFLSELPHLLAGIALAHAEALVAVLSGREARYRDGLESCARQLEVVRVGASGHKAGRDAT
jgi:hypothetical protein